MLGEIHWAISFILIIVALLLLFTIGVPIAFAMGLVAVVGLLMLPGAGMDTILNEFTSLTYSKVTPSIFICLPLFVLMTEIMSQSGMSRRLIELSHQTMGRLPGSLAVVAIVASTIFGAISGAAALGAMAMGDMLLPECMKRNYDKSLISGAIAAGGTLSIMIPPSFILILWGIIAKVSIGKLFMAGIIPGIIIAIMFCIYIVIRTKRNPSLAPMQPATSTKEKILALGKGWHVAVIIFIVIGGVYSGIASVTEISGVAALSAIILALITRSLTLSSMYTALRKTAEMITMFIMLLIGAYLLIYLLNRLDIPLNISEWVIDHKLTAIQLIIITQLLFFLLGMFIDAGSVMLIVLPLFLPSLRELEVDLIWLGVIISVSTMIANLTPPVGINLFIVQSVGRPYGITFVHVARGIVPFILIMIVGMALVLAFPPLATWLPSMMK